MPLPEEALVLEGGCKCRAVRYRMDVPEQSHRAFYPRTTPEHATRMPIVAVCHCNDCRTATGAIFLTGLLCEAATISTSLVIKSTSQYDEDAAKRSNDLEETRTPYLRAEEIFRLENEIRKDSFLRVYNSSKDRFRIFCSRCGTAIAYRALGLPEDWPVMIDLIHGTLDREYLENDWAKPERHVHCQSRAIQGHIWANL